MTAPENVGVERASADAMRVVAEFLREHRQSAIPALIGACVLWAVDNGGGEVVRGSLKNAVKLSRDMERANKRAGR